MISSHYKGPLQYVQDIWYHLYIYIWYIRILYCELLYCQCMTRAGSNQYLTWQVMDILFVKVNTSRPRQNDGHFPYDIFKCILLNENAWISIETSLRFVPKGLIKNIPALVQIMAWCRPGTKPLSEPMMVNLLTHICITRLQWVQLDKYGYFVWKINIWKANHVLATASIFDYWRVVLETNFRENNS